MKSKLYKSLATIITLVLMLTIIPVTSLAAVTSDTVYNGVDYALVYNYDFYMGYVDLKAAYGTRNDKAGAIKHFVTYGMKEGRQASANFNVLVYKANYTDLQKAFGESLVKYYKHYMNYGYKEGRNAVSLISSENSGETTTPTPMSTPNPETKTTTTSTSTATKTTTSSSGTTSKTVTPKAITCNHSSTTTRYNEKPTCTHSGSKVDVCTKCNKEVGTTKMVPALGHDYYINAIGIEVKVECSRCGSVLEVKTFQEFMKYHKGSSTDYFKLSKTEQDAVSAVWLRYNNAGLGLTQAQALKIIQNRPVNSDNLLLRVSIKNQDRAAQYICNIEKLSSLSYTKKSFKLLPLPHTETKTVKPFEVFDRITGALISNGYSSFVSDLRKDVKNSDEYKFLHTILDKLKKIDGYGTVHYIDMVVDSCAELINDAINIIDQRHKMLAKVEFRAYLDYVTFDDLVTNIDRYYSSYVGGERFGDKPDWSRHDQFIDYIISRANQEFKEIFGVDIREAKF